MNDRDRTTEALALRAYEAGRRSRAAELALPLLGIGVLAAVTGTRVPVAVFVSLAMTVLAFAFLVRGQGLGRAVVPGLLLGLVPFACARAAQHIPASMGHLCTGSACVSWCIPMCVGGGLVAGAVLGRLARRTSTPIAFALGAGALAALTGALGCACVGLSGVVGGVVGLGSGLLPTLAWPRRSFG